MNFMLFFTLLLIISVIFGYAIAYYIWSDNRKLSLPEKQNSLPEERSKVLYFTK